MLRNDFDGYGIQLKVHRGLEEWSKSASWGVFSLQAEEAALRRVAELAVEERTGARALVTILEKALVVGQDSNMRT